MLDNFSNQLAGNNSLQVSSPSSPSSPSPTILAHLSQLPPLQVPSLHPVFIDCVHQDSLSPRKANVQVQGVLLMAIVRQDLVSAVSVDTKES